MAAKYWIKLYLDMLDDPAVGRLSDALYRTFLQCMLAAGEAGDDGILPPIRDLAWRLRMKPHILAQRLEALGKAGLLEKNTDESWLVAGFKERQGPSPVKDRMRRYRKSNKRDEEESERYENVTKRNRSVTKKRYENVTGLSTKKIPDTDTEADAERKEEQDADADKIGGGSIQNNDILVKTFVEETGIPLYAGGEEKWREALGRMKRAGVTREDMLSALAECSAKGLVIANLGSIANPALITMSRRKARARPNPDEDYRRYLEGEYGDVGVA